MNYTETNDHTTNGLHHQNQLQQLNNTATKMHENQKGKCLAGPGFKVA